MQVGWVSPVQDRRIASFRYRVEAPLAGLRARGHDADLASVGGDGGEDVVVFSKAYNAEHRALAKAVKRRGGRVVFDICDNHFYNPFDLPKYRRAREEISEMMLIADRVICSTSALAAVIREETNGAVEPMVVGDSAERLKPRKRVSQADGPLRLTWFGSHGSPNAPSGMTDLLLIREQLEALAARHPVELTVCSNSREKFEGSIAQFNMPTHYVEWSLEGFPGVLAQSDGMVLPMSINPFTACKTHNRLSTALYAGVPVFASGIESYQEFAPYCTLDNWTDGLQALIERRDEERARALASRAHIDQRWSVEAMAVQWEAALALEPRKAKRSALAGQVLQGRLDAVARDAVTGWARAPMRPDQRVSVVLECDGEPVAIAVADQPRPDLQSAGLVGDCGFALPIPAYFAGGGYSRLSVRVLDTDWVVGENPILIAGGEHPSFIPVSTARSPQPRSPASVGEETRWNVGEAISAQEKILADLDAQRAAQPRMRAAATARSAERVSFRDLIHTAGADLPH